MENSKLDLEECYEAVDDVSSIEDRWTVIKGDTSYTWVKIRPIPVNQDVAFGIAVRGSLPVVCCTAEMDARNIPLIENDAVIELKSVQRRQNEIRVVVRRVAQQKTNLSVAVGIVAAIEE